MFHLCLICFYWLKTFRIDKYLWVEFCRILCGAITPVDFSSQSHEIQRKCALCTHSFVHTFVSVVRVLALFFLTWCSSKMHRQRARSSNVILTFHTHIGHITTKKSFCQTKHELKGGHSLAYSEQIDWLIVWHTQISTKANRIEVCRKLLLKQRVPRILQKSNSRSMCNLLWADAYRV